MQALAPSNHIIGSSSDPDQMSSVMIVEGAGLTKRTGGGVRSRIILSCLKDLGEVDVISIVTKKRHIARVTKVEGVRSHEIILVPDRKWSDIRRTLLALARGKTELPPQTAAHSLVGDKILELSNQTANGVVIVTRYFGAWALAALDGHEAIKNNAVWLDLDDREDKIVAGKLAKSRSSLMRRLGPSIAQLKKSEVAKAASSADVCSLASHVDVADLAPNANVIELANVVPASKRLPTAPSDAQDLLFVGTYNWPPNIDAIEWFITNCWDSIHAKQPQTKLHVVGGGTQSARDALAQKFKGKTQIAWHFDVPDLDDFYAQARAVISPVELGSGSKIKVIEAAAYGRPTIVTHHSARGLAKAMTDALAIADTAQEFADACLSYINNPSQADSDGAALRKAQIKHHSVQSFKLEAFAALQQAAPTLKFPQQTNEVQP